MRKMILAIWGLVAVSLAAQAEIKVAPPTWVVPGPNLPPEVHLRGSNNNLDIARFDGRLFFAFRTALTHFASANTRLYVLSSADDGRHWDYETEVFMGYDMREPRFLVLGNKLMFYYFRAGKNPFGFAPYHIYALERQSQGKWTAPTPVFEPECVLWRAKVRNGTAYATAYCGEGMYSGGNETINIYFLTTTDGYHFQPVNPAKPIVATGGSETAFEFDAAGNLYTVIRNEAGDGQTWGSKVCRAAPTDLSDWQCATTPFKYDSPLLFRRGDEIYLIARRNLDGEYDKNRRRLPDGLEGLYYLARYWWTPKRTALYRLDQAALRLDPVLDLPSRDDTAFPGLVPLDHDHYLVYNYTAPLPGRDRCWMAGQLTGAWIYSTVISFE